MLQTKEKNVEPQKFIIFSIVIKLLFLKQDDTEFEQTVITKITKYWINQKYFEQTV